MSFPRNERGFLVVKASDRYTLNLEPADGRWWLHMDVHRWSRETFEALKADEEVLLRAFGSLWALEVNPKQGRFIRMFGWKYAGIETDQHGKDRNSYMKGPNYGFKQE